MATSPMPQPGMGAPSAGAPAGPQAAQGGDSPASPDQMRLAQIYQVIRGMASGNPVLSSGLEKAAAGIQEAQSALVSQAPQSPAQNPQY